MFFVTFDINIRGDPSKKFGKVNNSNFHMISIPQNINFAPCDRDRFSQITSHFMSCENQNNNLSDHKIAKQIYFVVVVFRNMISTNTKKKCLFSTNIGPYVRLDPENIFINGPF